MLQISNWFDRFYTYTYIFIYKHWKKKKNKEKQNICFKKLTCSYFFVLAIFGCSDLAWIKFPTCSNDVY